MAVLYGLLLAGALTTLYPFFLMVSTGVKGPTDQNDHRLVPLFVLSESELYTKYIADKYRGDESAIASTRTGNSAPTELIEAYDAFLLQLSPDHWTPGFQTASNQVTGRLMQRYQGWLRTKYGNVEAVNKAYIDESPAIEVVQPPTELLERKAWRKPNSRKFQEWQEFKQSLPAEFRVPVRATRLYQEYVRAQSRAQWSDVPHDVRQGASRYEELTLPKSGTWFTDFKREALPARYAGNTAEGGWSIFLRDRNLPDAPMPIEAHERWFLSSHQEQVRTEFLTRNHRFVLDSMAINGRAVLNTVIYCLLAVLTMLTVNPIAAYALSRYPIKASGRILLFLLATMAFPAEVAMIPSFLLLKDAGLLNTFAALVLPTAASGYMIFLLKGFFDSLPQELFEASALDGAKESTMMMRIALPLSKPVLGYLGLLAFMGAYGAFMYAFLVAQDQKMWTIMVYIYQLQTVAPMSIMMAALTLAALPTLVIFLLAQNVIMRGIVLPGER
jgi:multiple sugar transport system permease protein